MPEQIKQFEKGFELSFEKAEGEKTQGIVKGRAVNTGVVDSWGDMFDKGAFDEFLKSTSEIHFYFLHNPGYPIGKGTLTKAGNHVNVQADLLLDKTENGTYINQKAGEIYNALQKGLKYDLSIGGRALEYVYEKIDNRVIRKITKADIVECSIVPRGAVPGATITDIKNDDYKYKEGANMPEIITKEEFTKAQGQITGLEGKITGMGETLTTIQTLTKSLEDKITLMGTAEEITLTKSEMGKLKDNFLKFQEDTEKAFEKMQKVKNVMPAEYEKEFILSHFRKSLTESFIKINENPGMVVDFGDTFLKGEATGDFPTSITEFEYWNTVWLAIQASNPILQDINILPIEGAKLEIPIELVGLPAVAWADELDTRNNTSGLNLGTIEVNINELYAYPKLTRTLLATERVAIQSLLAGRVEEALAFAIAEAILKGDGTKKPLGILKTQKVLDNALEMNINNITGDDLIDIYFKQEDNEIANSKWYMHKSWFAHILKLKNSQGDYLAFNSVIGGMLTPVLLGRPVTFVKTMPAFDKTASTYTDGDVPILFGSLKNGTLAIRNNKLQTSFQNGITDPRYIQFYTLTNVGSKVARPEFFHAIKHKGA